MISASIRVSGKVQGVWFRDYVRKESIKLNLNGWVRNNKDGSVSVEVEGDKQIIKDLIEKIKIGTPMSEVKDVSIEWREFENKYKSFKIVR